jgi:FAD/FMN-containing dehydrogenase/Fe-S oxidoreductase
MIPRLDVRTPIDPIYSAFIRELQFRGFEGEISVRESDRTVLATDNSIYQITPQVITSPKTTDDLIRLSKLASEDCFQAVTMAARGGGTGTNGQSLNEGLIIDTSRHMNRILEINPEGRFARVQSGVVKDQLNMALKPFGLFFAPELSTSNRATIGGMVNTDASGQGSCIYGKTRDHVLELATVLHGGVLWRSRPMNEETLREVQQRDDLVGDIHRLVDRIQVENKGLIERRFPKLNRCLTGYDLAHIRDKKGNFDLNSILCGSEGTLGILAEVTLNVLPIPKHSALINIWYTSFDAALRDAPALKILNPASIETVDSMVLQMARNDNIWLGVKEFFSETVEGETAGINLVEFISDDPNVLESVLNDVSKQISDNGKGSSRLGHSIARGEHAVERIWNMRKKAVGLLGNLKGDARPLPFVEDTCVPPENLADYILEFRALLDRRGVVYGMFGHVDVGVLHVRPAIDMRVPGQELLIREITDEVVSLTEKYHGLLWGEHGKGLRSEYSPRVFGPLYPLLQNIKSCFDPRNQLNPGKVAAPAKGALTRLDEKPMRGQIDRVIPIQVRKQYEEALNCNGNGACFNFDADDVMCPSWKGTRERRHSPKGRASLIREWLRQLSSVGIDPMEVGKNSSILGQVLTLPHRVLNTILKKQGKFDFSHEVMEAMSGCLACKSCVGQCPVKIDIPHFRSKFLEVYYLRYMRPVRDYLVGSLEYVLPIVAHIPKTYNFLVTNWASVQVLKWVGLVDSPVLSGVDLEKSLFTRGFQVATPELLNRVAAEDREKIVIVVQDAFTSFFDTQLVIDTFELLALLGFCPYLAPYKPNGKPMHVHGFLSRFRKTANANAMMLSQLAATGFPLVGIDPSMTLTYRSEYSKSLPECNIHVLLIQEWLSQRIHIAKFADARMREFCLLAHCTEKTNAPASMANWQTVFTAYNASLNIVASGCCGMAGTYGHESEHASTSATIYGQSWGLHLSSHNASTMLATGYSCRSQVKKMDGATILHPLQALLLLQRSKPS